MMLRIATRGSKLALWQAHFVRDQLRARQPSLEIELVIVQTIGDKTLDRPLAAIGGKGLFVKEIEEALLDGRADIAVHSMKDLPAEIPDQLVLAAVPEREDPRDALVVRSDLAARSIAELPRGTRVGTSSLRRVCQLRATRPDLDIQPLRGNVDTRLRKLDAGELGAIVLAAAGLIRLGWKARITRWIEPAEMLPAIGQGALALEARASDEHARRALVALHHPPTAVATAAERAFLRRLEGSCRTPMAAHATLDGASRQLALDGLVGRPDGTIVLSDRLAGPADQAEHLGTDLAERLLKRGADQILRECTITEPVVGP